MKLLLIGATRGIGRQVVQQALVQGHVLTVLDRRPQRLNVRHERLAVLQWR
jgi:short-subunit dehydrogenase